MSNEDEGMTYGQLQDLADHREACARLGAPHSQPEPVSSTMNKRMSKLAYDARDVYSERMPMMKDGIRLKLLSGSLALFKH